MIATRAFFAMYPILTGSQQNLVLKRDFPGDQWLRLCASTAEDTGLITGGGMKMLHGSTKKKKM